VCDTDFDTCDVFDITTPVARKPHRCGECDLPVKPGRTYVRVGSLYEGQWSTYHAHAECFALMRFIEKEVCGDHGTILLHGLGEEITNLNGYSVATLGERGDLVALGFADPVEDDDGRDPGAREVCEWLWDCIRAEYRTDEAP
jgi:hypothetical protein